MFEHTHLSCNQLKLVPQARILIRDNGIFEHYEICICYHNIQFTHNSSSSCNIVIHLYTL